MLKGADIASNYIICMSMLKSLKEEIYKNECDIGMTSSVTVFITKFMTLFLHPKCITEQ
jgi:hypothetical protein